MYIFAVFFPQRRGLSSMFLKCPAFLLTFVIHLGSVPGEKCHHGACRGLILRWGLKVVAIIIVAIIVAIIIVVMLIVVVI